MKLTFRPYQEKLVLQVKHHLNNGGDALIEQPTGSGKTFEIVALSASLLGTKFSHIIIAAPQQQIEEGFVSDQERVFQFELDSGASSELKVASDFIVQSREDGREGTIVNISRYLNNKVENAIVCTHAALTYLSAQNLPVSLIGYLLVIDEAHHAPAEGLDELIKVWKERGGNLLYATATPYRKDGKPVKREDMKLFRRLLTEHMEEGFAPSELKNEIVGISVQDEVSALEFSGEEVSKQEHRQLLIDAIYEAWIRDNKPKAIIRVPPGNSTEFIEELIIKFAGVNILNGAGIEKIDQKRFIEALRDTKEKSIDTSEYDIVVGVQRVLEGTDWAVCSHVYCVGIPGSLTMITQLIGRALRKKEATHPYANKAAVSFFVLGATENVLKNLHIKHSRHALLSCIFMADYNVGQEWLVSKQIIKGITSGLKNGDCSIEQAEANETDIREPISNETRSEVSLILLDAISSAIQNGEKLTVNKLIELVEVKYQLDIDNDILEQMIVENLSSRNDEIGKKILLAIEDKTKKYIRILPTIDKAKKAIFNEIVEEFRNETLEDSMSSIGLVNQLHKMTGGQIKEFCDRLVNVNYLPYIEASLIVKNENIRSQAEWLDYCKNRKPNNIPYHPERLYENKGWIDLATFVGSNKMRKFGSFLPFEEVRDLARGLKFSSIEMWQQWAGSDKRANIIPHSPDKVYKDAGWQGWSDFLGTGNIKNSEKLFISFDEAKNLIKNKFIRVKDFQVWAASDQRPIDFPSTPPSTFSKEWKGWGDFLGTGTVASKNLEFYSYLEARNIISKMKFSGKEAYQKYHTANKPNKIPYKPERTYKNEWIGWKDFLGTK